MIYQEVFACIPNNVIHSRCVVVMIKLSFFIFYLSLMLASYLYNISIGCRAALRQSMAHWKEKLGHTTIDLGVAPEKLESFQNGETNETDPLERLKAVRGFLVSFPLEFMRQEDLRPMFNESQFYAFSEVFH